MLVPREPIEPAPDDARAPKLRVSILVVEDNQVNQKVARLQLESLGYDVEIVCNGREALDAVAEKKFDIVLMDCAMPVMDGYEATRRIRELDAITGKHTRIVALTSQALTGDRENCLSVGMDDYLSKPVSIELLKEMIEKWLAEGAFEPLS